MNNKPLLSKIKSEDKLKELVVFIYVVALLSIGLLIQDSIDLLEGLKVIMSSPGLLITDYMVIGGVGAAIVNASLVGLIGFVILKLNKVVFNGPAIAAVFTMIGFGLFGKNIWSVLPIIFGVYLYSKIMNYQFKDNIYTALFGTALAPLVAYVSFEFQWGIPIGILFGILVGLVMPPIAAHVLKFHKGKNLYNIGFTAGVTGLLFVSIFRAFNLSIESVLIWGEEFNNISRMIVYPYFISMIILGIFLEGGKIKDYFKILKHPGTLITDFVSLEGLGNTLINMGLLAIIGCIYIELVNGHYNGPTVGGLFTMAGFAGFGKHPKNSIPIMLGVFLAALISPVLSPNDSTTMLAVLFGTALAPIAGEYGFIAGTLAGFTHLTIVRNVGVLHGGLNLYNNGFSGGFVAAIFVAMIEGYRKDRKK